MKSSEITKQAIDAPGGVVFLGIQTQNEKNELKRIELAARTCYKSEDKMTDESAEKLFNMLVKNEHYAMLRFGERTVAISEEMWKVFKINLITANQLQYWREHKNNEFQEHNLITITSNLQSWIFLFKLFDYDCVNSVCGYEGVSNDIHPIDVQSLIMKIFRHWPVVTGILKKQWSNPESIDRTYHDFEEVDIKNIPDSLKRYTFRVVTDRGITHEIVRHTTLSYAQESTRYINYNGQNPMMWIPPYLENEEELLDIFYENFNKSLVDYDNLTGGTITKNEDNNLERKKLIPGEARNVLPHSFKTEICISGYYDESTISSEFNQGFSHFIRLRASSKAHRGIQCIAKEIATHIRTERGLYNGNS